MFITTVPSIICNLQPILLDHFTATAKPSPTLPVRRSESVLIQAHLMALYTRQTATDELIDQVTSGLLSMVKGVKACASLLGKVNTEVLPQIVAGFIEKTQDVVGKFVANQTRVADVYRCDLDSVQPANLQLIAKGDPFFNDSNGTYRFRGKRDGTAEIEIYTVSGNFMHVPGQRNLFGKRSTAAVWRRAPIIVGRSRYLSVLREIHPVAPGRVAGNPVEKLITDGSRFAPGSYPTAAGTYTHKVTKIPGRNAWKIEASQQSNPDRGGSGGDIDVVLGLTPNRHNTQRIRVTATANTTAVPFAGSSNVGFTNRASVSGGASGLDSISLGTFTASSFAYELRRQHSDSATFDKTGATSGNVHTSVYAPGSGSGKVTVLIELLDQ
jgi:hypothetical protein